MIGRLFGRPRRVEFDIQPHVGILPVRLGASAEDVRSAMKRLGQELSSSRDSASQLRKLGIDPPDGLGHVDSYLDGSLQIEFTDKDLANFIGIRPDGDILATLKGRDVFDISAETLFDELKEQFNATDVVFDEFEVLFPEQILTLWNADPQYDVKGERFPVWGDRDRHAGVPQGNRRQQDSIASVSIDLRRRRLPRVLVPASEGRVEPAIRPYRRKAPGMDPVPVMRERSGGGPWFA